MSQISDNEAFIQQLLQERDEMYCELSRLRQANEGYVEALEARNKELDAQINKQNELVNKLEEQVYKLTDQLSWYRRKFWKASSERFIPSDPTSAKLILTDWMFFPRKKK